ncbi:Potassium transporter 5 [Stylosanthes scabra]|uniref:Potassium transporter n=1 Tax=Stylosanthes scabra TaxID=79078 RepID=A0ABU6Q3L6_9FABA|nr:Potassium transporter 5 [Stylosanthes scabra]
MEAMKSSKKETVEPKKKKMISDRKASWGKLVGRVDSLNLEAARIPSTHRHLVSWRTTLSLAFQSIGVIYGDIGTSPLYVYSSIFTDGINNTDDLLGCLSLIIYTIALFPFLKYVYIVLWANDNGDGGTFALYSLICRYSKVSLIPNHQPEDMQLSNYKLETSSNQLKRAQKIKHKLENSKFAQLLLFIVTIMSTSMVIGDGILTPSISVLSAISGIKSKSESLGQGKCFSLLKCNAIVHELEIKNFKVYHHSVVSGAVVGISIAILIILFSVQRYGTDKVGSAFAPMILVWFSFIAGIGLYNLFKYDVGVLRALNPKYIVDYFRRNGKKGWISLGGIFLCITGTEAMFADLGHFNVRAVQLSFSFITFPALVCAYSGQAAYLRKFPDHVANTFYDSIPSPIYWPTFVVAVAAAIIASQAMISGAYSIIQQSLSLGCFPSVSVIHTSGKYEGQVYIPEINYILMIACVIVCAAFRTTDNIGHAYGIAVCMVMLVTTGMVALIMLVIWKTSIWWIVLFVVVFGSVEIVYLSSMLTKFIQGGFLPLVLALFLMSIMATWHYTHKKRYMFEANNKVSSEFLREIVSKQVLSRIPGVALLYSELVEGIPPIFAKVVANIPHIHSVVVFISMKSIPISRVALDERFLFRQVQPKEYRIFRCVVRYGYNDVIGEPKEFEEQLIQQLKEFIRHQNFSHLNEGVGAGDAEQTDYHLQVSSQQQQSSRERSAKDGKGSSNRIIPVSICSNQVEDQEVQSQSGQQHPRSNPAINVSRASSGSIQSFGAGSRISNPTLQGIEEEIAFVQKAMEKSVIYMLGEAEVVAEPNSSILKKIVVNHIYDFLRRNFRQGEHLMAIPRSKLLRIGMTYEI